MSEEAIADSESFDMGAAQESIANDLFGEKEGEKEEVEVVEIEEEIIDETEQETEAEEETETETTEETTEETTATTRTPPQSWKKEMHEAFSTLPPEVQDYVEQREAQMREGLEKDRTDANIGRTMRDIMTPYTGLLQSQGVDEVTGVKYLLNAHQRLSTATGEEKKALANEFLKSYGISTDGQTDSELNQSPELNRLREELNGIKSHLTASQQRSLQEQQARVQADVEKFASDPSHAYFDDVADETAKLIQAGYTLEEAYDKAIWANPVTRQKEIDRIASEKEASIKDKAKQEAEKAKKAKSTNVRSQNTKKAPTGPSGTMEDTMRETLREIQNRT